MKTYLYNKAYKIGGPLFLSFFFSSYMFLGVLMQTFLGNPKQSLLAILLFVVNFCLMTRSVFQNKDYGRSITESVLYLMVFANILMFLTGKVVYESDLWGMSKHFLGFSPKFILLIFLVFYLIQYLRDRMLRMRPLMVLVGFFILLCFFAPLIFPNPFIDLYIILKQSAIDLLHGHNPYNRVYPDIYNGTYDYAYKKQAIKLVYWPLNIYIIAPFQAVLGDVRFADFFSLALGCFILYLHHGRRRMLFWSLALVFTFPYTFFMIKYGWIDALAFPFLALLFVILGGRKWLWSAPVLGFLMASKVYFLLLVPFCLIYLYKEGRPKTKLVLYVLFVGMSFSISFLPYIFTDYKSLVYTLQYFSVSGPRLDSLSIPGYLYRYRTDQTILFLVLFLGFYCFCIVDFCRRKHTGIDTLVQYISVSLFALFLSSKQAFGNYYYNIVLLSLISIITSPKATRPNGPLTH